MGHLIIDSLLHWDSLGHPMHCGRRKEAEAGMDRVRRQQRPAWRQTLPQANHLLLLAPHLPQLDSVASWPQRGVAHLAALRPGSRGDPAYGAAEPGATHALASPGSRSSEAHARQDGLFCAKTLST